MDSSHDTLASTGLGAGRRTADRQSGVQATDGDEEALLEIILRGGGESVLSDQIKLFNFILRFIYATSIK